MTNSTTAFNANMLKTYCCRQFNRISKEMFRMCCMVNVTAWGIRKYKKYKKEISWY